MSLSDVEPLDSPQYDALTSITRSLHLRHAMASYGKQRLTSHKIVSKTVDLNVKVLWFAPTRPMKENNMYGNVSFTLDWQTARRQLGPHLYYVDQQENGEFIYSRVLLTDKEYDFLTPVDEGGHRMPMLKSGPNHYVATTSEGVKHVLEIGVEVNCQREKWIYLNCKIQANNHSSANTLLYPGGPFVPCNCHRFNYFHNECPSPYNLQKTKKILEKRCPEMLRDGPDRSLGVTRGTQVVQRTSHRVALVHDEGYEDDEEDYDSYDFVGDYDDHGMVRGYKTPAMRTVEQTNVVKTEFINKTPPDTSRAAGASVGAVGFASSSVMSSSSATSRANELQSLRDRIHASSLEDTSFDSWVPRTSSASRFTPATPKKGRDEGPSAGDVVLAAVVAGGIGLFAGLAALFSGNGDKNKRENKNKTWWS